MKWIFLIAFIGCSIRIYAQTEDTVSVRFRLLNEEDEPMIGATLYVKDSNPPIGTISDINGNALLTLPGNENTVVLSFLGPYVSFRIKQPVDSVCLNLKKRVAVYYFENKKVKKARLNISEY